VGVSSLLFLFERGEIVKKKISIVLLTFILTINFTFGRVQEAKAEVITLTTIAVASAILLAAGVVYQNRFELYKMAEEYADDLKNTSDALLQTSTGIIVGVGAFASLKNYLTNKALNPVTNTTYQKAYVTNGIFNYTLKKPNLSNVSDISPTYYLPLEQNIQYTFYATYINKDSGKIDNKIYTFGSSSSTYLNYRTYYTQGPNRQVNVEMTLQDGRVLDIGAIWADGSEYSVCVDFKVTGLNLTKEQSISIDYSGALTGASEEKAKVAIPVGSVVTPKEFEVPTDLSGEVPAINDLVDVQNPAQVETGELEMDIPNVQDTIKNKFDDPNLRNTWKAIEEMDTSRGAPPKITFDLSKLFNAATSRFNVKNPFPSKEYTLIDFGMLQDYNFGGSPLIDYFRGLVGMGFIITTFMYCWRKLTPDNVLGD